MGFPTVKLIIYWIKLSLTFTKL